MVGNFERKIHYVEGWLDREQFVRFESGRMHIISRSWKAKNMVRVASLKRLINGTVKEWGSGFFPQQKNLQKDQSSLWTNSQCLQRFQVWAFIIPIWNFFSFSEFLFNALNSISSFVGNQLFIHLLRLIILGGLFFSLR